MNKFQSRLKEGLFLLLGMSLGSYAITSILTLHNLPTGGITGIALVLDNVLNLNFEYVFYALSIAVLICTFIFLGKVEAKKIIILSLAYPIMIFIFQKLDLGFPKGDIFLAAIYYGVIGGIGNGIILKTGYSAGGTDSIGKIIHRRIYPFISLSIIITAVDFVVLLVAAFTFGMEKALYALVTQLVFLRATEFILYGISAKHVKVEIISSSYVEIEDYIINKVGRGVTRSFIRGAYSNEDRLKLSCICSPRESLLLKTHISHTDIKAFVYVSELKSVWGQGAGFQSFLESD